MSAPCFQSFTFSVLLHWLGCGPHCFQPEPWQQFGDRCSASSPPPEQHRPVGIPTCRILNAFPLPPDESCSPSWPALTPPYTLGFPWHHTHNALLLPNQPALTFPQYAMPFLRITPCPCPLAHMEFPHPYSESFKSCTLNLHSSVQPPRTAAPEHPGFRTLLHT